MVYGLGVKKQKDRKCSLYKFTFIALLDKKNNKLEENKKDKTKQMKHNQKIINKYKKPTE